jgi:hypothetical protein
LTAQSKKRLNPLLLHAGSTSRAARGEMLGSPVFCSIFCVPRAATASLVSNFLPEKIADLSEKIAAVDKPPH